MYNKITRYCSMFALFSFVFVALATGFFHLGWWDVDTILAEDCALVNTEPTIAPRTIIIDAGHGGRDPGASSGDVLEKDLNLEISLILADLLRFMGHQVIMTRTEDVSLGSQVPGQQKRGDLQARLNLSRQHPEAIFVSIHMNTFPSPNVSGMHIYYVRNCEESAEIARRLRALNMQHLDPEADHAPKQSTSALFVLSRMSNPAVLVECGFLTCPRDLELLQCPNHQRKLALVIAAAVVG